MRENRYLKVLQGLLHENQTALANAKDAAEAAEHKRLVERVFQMMEAEMSRKKTAQCHALETLEDFIQAVLAAPELTYDIQHSLKNFWVHGYFFDKCDLTQN